MRRSVLRAIAGCSTFALWCGGSPPARAHDLAGAGSPRMAVQGAGAAALGGSHAGPFANPALLGGAPRGEVVFGSAFGVNETAAPRIGLAWPTIAGPVWGAGWERSVPGTVEETGPAAPNAGMGDPPQTSAVFVALASPDGRRLRYGTSLELRGAAGTARAGSFAAHAGVHARPMPRRLPGFEFGAWLRNAVRPEAATGGFEPRRLDVGAAYGARVGGDWRMTTTLGLETVAGAMSRPWIGTDWEWQDRASVATAVTDDAWRAGLGLRVRDVRLEYAFERAADTHHAVALRFAWGTSVADRRAAERQSLETAVAMDLTRAAEERRAQDLDRWLGEGQQALLGGDHRRAAECFRNVLLWSPEHEPARTGLRRAQLGTLIQRADSLVERGDWWTAGSQLEHAARLFPTDSLVAVRLQQVRSAIDRAEWTRTEAAVQFQLGLEAFTAQRPAAALRCFEAALRLDRSHAMAAEFAARARTALDAQVQSALAQARVRLDRRDPAGAREILAPVLQELPDHPEALRLVSQAERDIERDGQERRIAEARRQEAAAREDRSPAPVPSPQLAAAYQQGLSMYRAGDLDAAMRAWEDVRRTAPHFEEVDQYLIRVYRVVGLERYTEGRLQDAIDIWSKALQLEPDNGQVRRYLEQANAKLQRVQGVRGGR